MLAKSIEIDRGVVFSVVLRVVTPRIHTFYFPLALVAVSEGQRLLSVLAENGFLRTQGIRGLGGKRVEDIGTMRSWSIRRNRKIPVLSLILKDGKDHWLV